MCGERLGWVMGVRQWFKELAEDVFVCNVEEELDECIKNPGHFSKEEVARRAWDAGVRPEHACESIAEKYGKSGWSL